MSKLRNMLINEESEKFGILPIEKIDLALIKLFQQESKINDHKDLHSLAEELGLDPSELEERVYAMLQSFWSKGRAKEKDLDWTSVDVKEVKMGIDVEKEHTTNKYMAYRIALDHLAELPDYYTRLAKMEKSE